MGLGGHIVEAAESPYANYVVQKVIEVLHPSSVSFIINELLGFGTQVVQNRFGVRVFKCLLDYCPRDMIEDLIVEVTQDIGQLCHSRYGSYFAQHLIERDFEGQGWKVVSAVMENPIHYGSSWKGCHLIITALDFLGPTQRHAFFDKFMEDTNALIQLSCSPVGRKLMQSIFSFPESGNVRAVLFQASSNLRASRAGRVVLAQLRTGNVST